MVGNQSTISTTYKSSKLRELRIPTVLFLLLASVGTRPTSILHLRFGDIRVALERDPEGGPHKLLIRFTLAFIKTYLRVKDANTFLIPETFFDPSLLLSPHVFLMDIRPGERELWLPLKQDFDNILIFRRTVKTLTGYELSPNESISYQMMTTWIRRINELLSLEYPTIPYNLRYNAANEFDQSGEVNEAPRNLALDHASSGPFRNHYLAWEVGADTWVIIRGQKPHVGHSLNKRRPTDLTSEQAAPVNTDPHIKRLGRELRRLRLGSKKYKEARLKLRSEKMRLKRILKQKIRDEWTADQVVDDMEPQLKGNWRPDEAKDRRCRPQRPAQRRLVQALTAPSDNTSEGQYQRRRNAIDAIVAYCIVEEGQTVRHTNTSSSNPSRDVTTRGPQVESALQIATKSVFVKTESERPRRCFVCVGKALSLAPDDGGVEDFIREFYTAGDLSKHFRRRHLSNLRNNNEICCKVCETLLDNKMHFQNQAMRVHGLKS
ncbi:hypothetical protein Cpir12675_003820 [Ceratocystis pirilliformis]|uniref:C2H2-type domain-containing protein n=1 Tax=Ceratocystis pirilliformis TaxID=259994 RepID=A0ABR3Z0B2_9PEZI